MLRIRPCDFYEYTFDEYVKARKGYYDSLESQRRADYNNARLNAYYSILPHLKPSDQRKSIDQIIPDGWDGGDKASELSMKSQYDERWAKLRRIREGRAKAAADKNKKENG
jgi:hypothetical protein